MNDEINKASARAAFRIQLHNLCEEHLRGLALADLVAALENEKFCLQMKAFNEAGELLTQMTRAVQILTTNEPIRETIIRTEQGKAR